VIEQAAEQPARPKILLVGDASARPTGLERALTRAGFQLVEQEDPGNAPEADAVLITLLDIDERPLTQLLPPGPPESGTAPPRLVILSTPNRDGPAAALALGAADALVAPVHLPELCARLYTRIREHKYPDPAAAPPSSNGREATGAGEEPEAGPGTEALDRKVQEEFERARRYSLSFSLVLLGVDELPDPDQPAGAEKADQIRYEVGQVLRRELRLPDFVIPYGSSEFAIVLPETDQTGARQSVIRVRQRLAAVPLEGDPRLERNRFSAGIVTYPHPAAFQADDLFAMAEAALMRGRAQVGERIGVAL
jgi:two-component system, cell cycle response regulator